MGKIKVNIEDLSAFLDLVKLYASEKKDPELTDLAWSLSDCFLNEDSAGFIRYDLEQWSQGQIEFYEPKE